MPPRQDSRASGVRTRPSHTSDPQQKWISGKSYQAFACCPFGITDPAIVLNIVGQMGFSFRCDQTDLELAYRNTSVAAVGVRRQSRTCLQLQQIVAVVERPDVSQGGVQIPDEQFGTGLQHFCLRGWLAQRYGHGSSERGQLGAPWSRSVNIFLFVKSLITLLNPSNSPQAS